MFYTATTVAVLINTPPKNNFNDYQPRVAHNQSTEINIQAQVAHYLERRVVISEKIDGVEKMACSTLGLLSTVRGYHAYRQMWTPVVSESLTAARESGNVHDS